MLAILRIFLRDLLKDAATGLSNLFNMNVLTLLDYVFYFENSLPGNNTWSQEISRAYNALYWFSTGLLALKLLYKGFKVYILWRDGDAEIDPGTMLKDSAWAMAVAASFPLLYGILAEIIPYVLTTVINCFTNSFDAYLGMSNVATVALSISNNMAIGPNVNEMVTIVLLLIVLIMSVVLYFTLLVRGAVMLVFRLGVPFAVTGLLDSDGGVWKGYIQILFQASATALAQAFLLMLAMNLFAQAANGNSFLAVLSIVLMVGAFAVPKFMSRFMMTGGGGGGVTQKAYMLANVARAFIA